MENNLPRKKALITGITGQDGSYLAEFLLEKGYEVHGIKRRSSLFNTQRIDHLYQDIHAEDKRLMLHYGDLTDTSNLTRIIQEIQPDEVYNLGAQSHVAVSFESPEYTADVDALGTLRILEAIRLLGLEKKPVFIRLLLQSYMGWYKKFHKGKPHPSTHVRPMLQPNFMPTGSQLTTVKPMVCMLAMVFCLTTNLHAVVRPLSHAKLPEDWPILLKGLKIACI